jgi:hypothetical protein
LGAVGCYQRHISIQYMKRTGSAAVDRELAYIDDERRRMADLATTMVGRKDRGEGGRG